MKKRFLSVSLAIVCTLAMTACGGTKAPASNNTQETTTEASVEADTSEESSEAEDKEVIEESTETGKPAAKPAANVPSELSDDIYSFQLSIDGTVYQFPMWFSDFEALGWTYIDENEDEILKSYQYTFSCRWKKDDITVYTQFANLSMNSVAIKDSMVSGITIDPYYLKDCDWEILLPGGIQYNVSTRDDIIAAYGEPSDEYEGDMYYDMTYEYDSYQDIELYVYKESGVLEKIELRNMVELEGADNSVNTEVPEIVKGYTAPTALGDDLYQFNMELEGNLYTLPCPVSELLANGFTLSKDAPEAIAAGGFDWVELKYNNQNYRTMVHNYADYATIPENCFVTSMESSIFNPDFALTIPCGIKRGDSEESLLKTLENFNYKIEESGDFKYYNVYNPDGSSLDKFQITVKEGEVVIIEVDNSNKPEY